MFTLGVDTTARVCGPSSVRYYWSTTDAFTTVQLLSVTTTGVAAQSGGDTVTLQLVLVDAVGDLHAVCTASNAGGADPGCQASPPVDGVALMLEVSSTAELSFHFTVTAT